MATTDHLSTSRPALARDVALAGAMPGTGYVDQPWLVRRGEQFLQVSEILYRVLELANGERDVAQIAEALTQQTDWAVQPDAVQHLIDSKLRPMRLLADPATAAQAPPPPQRSPLQMQMHMKVLPRRAIDALTGVLQHFFSPWILVPMIVLVVISHWWVYSMYGAQRSLETLLYRPGALLAVIALAVVAGLFHELGHASALTYGGGRTRGIGFGLYLVYPAFYSDVTDSYRLSRAARVRTDLGGIYFHFIFAVALIGIFAVTGSRFLLAAVLLFNIEALRQFTPFVRLDGYWLLADLTGVPDFFSQAEPLARRQLPALKPWVKRVFVTYMAITIPVLAYAFVMMLAYAPELVRKTLHAVTFHAGVLASDLPAATKVLSLTQMVLLPVPVLALAFFLYSMALVPLNRLASTRLSQKAIRYVAAPATAAIVLMAVTAIGWSGAAPNRGQKLLAEARATLAAATSLHADLRGAIGGEMFTGRMQLARPNRARVEVEGSDAVGTFAVISDGRKVYVSFPQHAQYTEAKAASDGRNINAFVVDPVRMFFAPDRLTEIADDEQVRYVGRERVGAAELDVVEIASSHPRKPVWRYWLSDDHLVRRVMSTTPTATGESAVRWVQLENVRTDAPADAEAFAFTPAGKRLGLADLGIDLSAGRH